jgi:epoxyqueuosine reductase
VSVSVDHLRQVGLDAGLHAVGVATAEVQERARALLHERKAAGLSDGMAFTYRNPDRSTEIARTIPWARSLVVAACSYARPEVAPRPGRPAGAVARYARFDAYGPLRSGLRAVAAELKAAGHRAAVLADDNSLVDREVAWRAGLGWYGRNANLLIPGQGSFFVLGSVVTDADLPADRPVDDGCGSCRRCLDGCPTGAIVAPGVIDARRCLAWVAQRPGPIEVPLRAPFGTRVYGCDDCQDVCPPNLRAERRQEGGEAVPATVDLIWLLEADDDEVLDACGRWYIHHRDPRWLRRNALVALGNHPSPTEAGLAVLRGYAHGSDELLAEHARWALHQQDAAAPIPR